VRPHEQRNGTFATLIADDPDAWFERRGLDIAALSCTKGGIPKRYGNGILLLCNERGCPLRWCTMPGRVRDSETLRDVVGAIEDRQRAQNVPSVPWGQLAPWQGCGTASCTSSPPCPDLRSVASDNARGFR